MAVKLRRVNPLEIREQAIDCFWRLRAWPFETRAEYERCWDWRYTAIPEAEPIAWVAADGETIIGHVACNIRRFRLNDRHVIAGIPGNFLVDPAYHNSMIGAQLAAAPIKLAQRGETDIFIGYGNQIAHALTLGLGCRNIGRFRPYVDIRRSAPALQRRIPGGALLAPAVDGALAVWRGVTGRNRARVPRHLQARPLAAAELAAIDTQGWRPRDGLTWNGSCAYLARRFLGCPIRAYRADAVVDSRDGAVQAVVISEPNPRFNVVLCLANAGRVSELEAVEVVLRASPATEVARVALLPGTGLAEAFAGSGFIERDYGDSDAVLQNTTWSAFWRPAHELAAEFSKTERWAVWYGWNSH